MIDFNRASDWTATPNVLLSAPANAPGGFNWPTIARFCVAIINRNMPHFTAVWHLYDPQLYSGNYTFNMLGELIRHMLPARGLFWVELVLIDKGGLQIYFWGFPVYIVPIQYTSSYNSVSSFKHFLGENESDNLCQRRRLRSDLLESFQKESFSTQLMNTQTIHR